MWQVTLVMSKIANLDASQEPFLDFFDEWELLKLLKFSSKIHYLSKAYSEPCQTSKMELFAKIVSGVKPLTTFLTWFIQDF